MIKPPRVAKRLVHERDYYLSCITSILCDNILKGDLVYHGHTGHLLLPGIPNIFRLRIIADIKHRLAFVVDKLNISQEKALKYIQDVDADRDKWVRFLYGADWTSPAQYDLIVNLAQMSSSNAAAALFNIVDLPDFKLTPAAIKAIKNLRLASKARFLLCKDKRTRMADFKITADDGIVQVTCMPHQAEVAQYVNEILQGLEDCQKINCTIARSNILWLGEEFPVDSDTFRCLVKLAKKWDAAVEIMRYAAEEGSEIEPELPEITTLNKENGGIEDDVKESVKTDPSGAHQVLDELKRLGCSGGSLTIYGDKENLITNIAQHTNYSLVVIGNMFTSKASSIRKRLTSELRGILMDRIKSPVIGAEELMQELKMGIKEYLKMGIYFVVALALFIGVFTNQQTVITLMTDEKYHSWRIPIIGVLLLFIPTFALCYGNTTRRILKFFKLD